MPESRAVPQAPLERRQPFSEDREMTPSDAMAGLIDRQVADDRDEPRREASSMVRLLTVLAEAAQISFAEGFTDPGENVRCVVRVSK